MLDLKALLAKMLSMISKGEYRTLLWTNPNPTQGFSTTYILNGQDLTIYDEIEVYGINYTTYTSVMPTVKVPRGAKGNLIGLAGSSGDSTGTGFLVARGIRFNDTSILIANAAGVATNGNSWSVNNNNMIPIKIYGIKYGGGHLTSKFYEIFSHLERWWEYVRFKEIVGENIKESSASGYILKIGNVTPKRTKCDIHRHKHTEWSNCHRCLSDKNTERELGVQWNHSIQQYNSGSSLPQYVGVSNKRVIRSSGILHDITIPQRRCLAC